MPSLVGLVAGSEDWCRQEVATIVIASEFWEAAIQGALCLPCDVGLMLMV